MSSACSGISKRQSLGDEAYCIRFTPRKPTSIWSAINVGKVHELTAQGRMHAAGLRAFAARTEAKTGVYSFEQKEAPELPAVSVERLRANRKAWAYFNAQPPWYQRGAAHWVTSAKRQDTQERRLQQLIAASAAGRPVPPLARPGAKGEVSDRKKPPRR